MFNKFALVTLGLLLTVSSVGCCCLGHGYGAGYRPVGCPPCNNSCPPAGGSYYQQGAFYPGDTTTAAFSSGVTQSAMVPVQSASLPTMSAAALPGAVQGPPIYTNTAILPGAALPVY